MGIDISGSFQRRVADRWVFVESYYDGTRGFLRSWLAPWGGVAIEPIAPWRGLPCDLPESAHFQPTIEGCTSWLTGDEILNALPLQERSIEFMSDAQFAQRRQKSFWLENYDLKLIRAQRRRFEVGFTAEHWGVDLVFDRSDMVQEFVARVKALRELHGDIRFVFVYV